MNFKDFIERAGDEFKQTLEAEYSKILEDIDVDLKKFYEQISYPLYSRGKRLRPILLLKSYEIFGGKNINLAEKFAIAIECIHTYSLVHDDLPAMDDDDMRRGKPTCHKVFGEDIAILIGDALLNLSFELMSEATMNAGEDMKSALRAMNVIANNAGGSGMVGGQVLEIYYGEDSQEKALKVEILKTSKLFIASILAGAILAGAGETELKILEEYAENIGVAFQIKDDMMDDSGPYAGKAAKEKADFYVKNALEKIKNLDIDTKFYESLADYMVTRRK